MTNEEIKGILEYPETTLIEYKREEYPIEKKAAKKHELLKDISALANHPNNSDKFIVIGMKDGNFYEIDGPIDDNHYQQYLKENIDPIINFEYRGLEYSGHKIAVFRIFGNNDRPYLIKKKIVNSEGKDIYLAGDGFIRRGTKADRLLRKDFDRMYADKYVAKDRKDDLKVIPKWSFIEHDDFYKTDLYCIDLDIINKSNQSLDITVELKIKKGNTYKINVKDDIEREKHRLRNADKRPFDWEAPYVSSFFVVCSESETEYVIGKGLKPKINIEQRETISDFFWGEAFFIGLPNDFSGEVVVKSDSFTDGPMIVPIPNPTR